MSAENVGEQHVSNNYSNETGEIGRKEPNHPPEKDPRPQDLEAALTLLKKNDDTSRFVGLALLKPVLEQELSNDQTVTAVKTDALVQRCWSAIPIKFLDRLLKARANEKRSKEEANNMVGLAVGVLHVFMTLLHAPEMDERFIGRIPLLRTVLRSYAPATRPQILEIFHVLALTPQGSSIIFKSNTTENISSEKPESYLFITMLLIDIRSTIPSLQEQLHTKEYPAISERLSKSYDIISAFIAFLIRSLENPSPSSSSPLPISLLLKLRTNISETLSQTIEHLRDRYDSSTAGAAGLHPSARAPATTTPLPITWDTPTALSHSPLTLSQLRTLSLWLRDEENNTLRQEASGITDVLLALYQNTSEQDFRSPVLIAFEGILQTSTGIDVFLRENGWHILADDLTTILAHPEPRHTHTLAIEIIRILLSVTESEDAGPAKEDWMTSIIPLASTSLKSPSSPPSSSTQPSTLELPIALSQLAVELLIRAPVGLRREFRVQAQGLLRTATILIGEDSVKGEDRDGLEEVVEGLKSVGF